MPIQRSHCTLSAAIKKRRSRPTCHRPAIHKSSLCRPAPYVPRSRRRHANRPAQRAAISNATPLTTSCSNPNSESHRSELLEPVSIQTRLPASARRRRLRPPRSLAYARRRGGDGNPNGGPRQQQPPPLHAPQRRLPLRAPLCAVPLGGSRSLPFLSLPPC
jgi:hypothetical protein